MKHKFAEEILITNLKEYDIRTKQPLQHLPLRMVE